MQKIRKILKAVYEKTALPTNKPTYQPTNQLLPTTPILWDLADADPIKMFLCYWFYSLNILRYKTFRFENSYWNMKSNEIKMNMALKQVKWYKMTKWNFNEISLMLIKFFKRTSCNDFCTNCALKTFRVDWRWGVRNRGLLRLLMFWNAKNLPSFKVCELPFTSVNWRWTNCYIIIA